MASARPAEAAQVVCDVPSDAYPSIQAAVDDSDCTTVNLTAPLYTTGAFIIRDVTITGQGTAATTVSGEGMSRPFFIEAGAHVTLTHMTIANGYADDGGGVHSTGGLVVIDDLVFENNTATDSGGALFTYAGELTISNSRFAGNVATGNGGAVMQELGTSQIADTQFEGNSSTAFNAGAYHVFGGTATFANSDFYDNHAFDTAGALYPSLSTITLRDSHVWGNSADFGGGIYVFASAVTLYNSVVHDNTATIQGGGFANKSGNIVTYDSDIHHNTAAAGGGFYFNGGFSSLNGTRVYSNTASVGNGGGIQLETGSLTILGSTLHHNQSAQDGGAIAQALGTLTVGGSTLAHNSAGVNGGGLTNASGQAELVATTVTGNAAISGGGAYNRQSLAVENSTLYANTGVNGAGLMHAGDLIGDATTVRNSTLSDNAATGNGDGLYANNVGSVTLTNVTVAFNDGTGIFQADGSGSAVTARNSVIAGNGGIDCNLPLDDAGTPNLDSDESCGASITADPLLQPLATNGGATLSHALPANSPAVDAGAALVCPAFDQRHALRPQGNGCDLGAYEVIANAAADTIYLSPRAVGLAGTFYATPGDIVSYNRGTGLWSVWLNSSDYGWKHSAHIDAFLLYNGRAVVSFAEPITLGALGLVDDSDLVLINGANLVFAFDGSDVGLDSDEEDVDAIVAVNGRLGISTDGAFSVPGLSGDDEDVIILNGASFGNNTSGTWAWHFDGSDVGLGGDDARDIEGLWQSGNRLYANMAGSFVVSGITITPSDIAVCNNFVAGSNTSCGGGSGIYWYGAAAGLDTNGLDAFTVVSPAVETPVISGLEQLISR